MRQQRVHILSAVNAANVSKAGSTYTIKDVVGCVDGLVMNGMLYPGDQLAAGAPTLEGKPAPAGHPKNADGAYISALNGEALLTSYAGAVCRNARHEGGRTLVDVLVNEAQAKAHPDGGKLIERLDAAMNGTNAEPIHVSTGLFCAPVTANGESLGKKYRRIATNIQYDHLAILLNEQGAGTPAQGVGMFLNADGSQGEVEVAALDFDRRDEGLGLRGWLRKLLGNESELSFEQIREGLYKTLPDGAWVREVFGRYAIWSDDAGKLYRQDYGVSSDGSIAWSGTAQEVREEREYEPVNNLQRDPMKDMLIAALNAAGIKTEGLADAELLAAYNAHVSAAAVAPVKTELAAANAQLATLQANAAAAEKAELDTLAAQLATNAKGLTAADFVAMGLKRCKELAAAGTVAAPVLPGSPVGNADEFAAYDPNALIDAAAKGRAAA